MSRAPAAAVTAQILAEETSQLLRAHGHVASRKRFKGGPVRQVAPPDRCLLFIDESGKSVPSATDYFAVGAVAMTGAESERYRSRADLLKDRFWGHRGITLHEPHMSRHDGDFYFDGDLAGVDPLSWTVNRVAGQATALSERYLLSYSVGER